VIFEHALLPADALVGAEGQGWEQVMAELAYERSGPERYLSCYPLLRELMALCEHDASERQQVQIGYEVARLATLRAMSLSVAGMLGAGANPALEASVVKDQGALFEQALPGTAPALVDETPSTDAGASDFRQMLGHLVQNAPSFSPAEILTHQDLEEKRGNMLVRASNLCDLFPRAPTRAEADRRVPRATP